MKKLLSVLMAALLVVMSIAPFCLSASAEENTADSVSELTQTDEENDQSEPPVSLTFDEEKNEFCDDEGRPAYYPVIENGKLFDKASEKPSFYEAPDDSKETDESTEAAGNDAGKKDLSGTGAESDEAPVSATVASGTSGDCEWRLNNGVLTISGNGVFKAPSDAYKWGKEVTKIIVHEGVTELGTAALSYCYNTKEAKLPESLTKIGDSNFSRFSDLETVNIPDSVTYIGESAFRSCTKITVTSLPSSLTHLGAHAFDITNNFKIKITKIPDGLEVIEDKALQGNRADKYSIELGASTRYLFDGVSLGRCQSITVPNSNRYFHDIDGVLFDNDNILICYPQARENDTYRIPDKTTEIGKDAFHSTTYLRHVTMPDTVTVINDMAFYDTRLESIQFSKNLKEIGSGALSLTGVKDLTYPEGIIRIEGCETSENFKVKIPKSVMYGVASFPQGTYLEVDPANPYFTSVNGSVYNKDKTILYHYSGKYNEAFKAPSTLVTIPAGTISRAKSVELNEGLRVIGANNFNFLEQSRITIPDSVTYIGDNCFYGCKTDEVIFGKNLKEMKLGFKGEYIPRLKFKGNQPNVDFSFSTYSNRIVEIYIPKGDSTWNTDTAFADAGFKSYYKVYTWDTVVTDPVDISKCKATLSQTSYTYDGTLHRPNVKVTYNGKELIKDFDYILTYGYGLEAGTGYAVLNGQRNFYGSVTKEYTIKKASSSVSATATPQEIKVGETSIIKAHGTGKISYQSSDSKIAEVNASGLVTAKKAGTVTITVKAAGDKNYEAASTTVQITVKNNKEKMKVTDFSYQFSNSKSGFGYPSDYKIPIDRYYMFLPEERAQYFFNRSSGWGGNCFGMTNSSSLFYDDFSDLNLTDFRSSATRPNQLKLTDYNSRLRINLQDLIESLLVSQYTEYMQYMNSVHQDKLDNMLTEVKKCDKGGMPVVFNYGIEKIGGHSLLAYRYDQLTSTTGRIAVYDCNHPNTECYIDITTTSFGQAKTWKYTIAGLECGTNIGYIVKGNPCRSFMSYLTYDSVKANWDNRRTNKSRDNSSFSVNSDNFVIKNAHGITVATMNNGTFSSYDTGIYETKTVDTQSESRFFHVPTGDYSITADNIDIDNKLEVTMVNSEQSVNIVTDSDTIGLLTDDENLTSMAKVNGDPGEKYKITINSSLECAKDAEEIYYYGTCSGNNVTVGSQNGETYVKNYDRSSAVIEGKPTPVEEAGTDIASVIPDFSLKTEQKSYQYTGEPIKPKVTYGYTTSSYEPVEGNDYYVTYSNNINVGKYATATLHGIGDYSGTVSVSFQITPAYIDEASVDFIEKDVYYNGTEKRPEMLVAFNQKILEENVDYSISYQYNTEPGKNTAKAVIKAENNSNFTGSLTLWFSIKFNEKGLLGDIDFNDEVNTVDTTLIQRKLTNTEIPFAFYDKAADTTQDGQTSIMDVTYIQKWLSHIKSNDNIGKPMT